MLGKALTAARNALKNPDCQKIFNTDPSKPRNDPATVLEAMAMGIPLGGTRIGAVTAGRIPLRYAAVTKAGPDAVPTGSGEVRASSADIIVQDNPLGYPYWESSAGGLALTLLHELGHVFNIVTSLGGSSIINDVSPDGTVNQEAEIANAKTLAPCHPTLN
jgi:hypothetical protein